MDTLEGLCLVEPNPQLVDFRVAAREEPGPGMPPGEIAARRLMQDNPGKFAEIWEALERAHAEKEREFLRRQEEQEARLRDQNMQAGIVTPEQTDQGGEKVLDKLRELSERAEG